MEKRTSPKNRKSAKQPIDKGKIPPVIRDARTGRFLLSATAPLKDVLVHLKKRGDYVVFANPSRTKVEVVEDILIGSSPLQTSSDQERALSDSAVDPIIDRATEVIGDRQEAMRWLGRPVRGLDFATPISLLATKEGQMRVNDILGQMEHGIW